MMRGGSRVGWWVGGAIVAVWAVRDPIGAAHAAQRIGHALATFVGILWH